MSPEAFEELLVLLAIGAGPASALPTVAEIKKRLRPFLAGGERKAADERVAEHLASGIRDGAIVEQRKKGGAARLTLSKSGERRVTEVIGSGHTLSGWVKVRDTIVTPLALGVDMKTGAAFASFEKLRNYLALEGAGISFRSSYTGAAVLNLLAAKSVSSTASTQKGIREAAIARALRPDRRPRAAMQNDAAEPRRDDGPLEQRVGAVEAPRSDELTTFAHRVRMAAAETRTGRYGRDRVFISHVMRTLGKSALDTEMRAQLLEANRRGLLELARADLIADFPADDVQNSEVRGPLGDVYHFIVSEA